MRYARVNVYRVEKAALDESMAKVRTGLLPLFQSMPGFCEYRVVAGDDGRGVSLTIWETRAQAEQALESAQEWVGRNLGDRITIEQAYVGSVQLAEAAAADAMVRGFVEAFNTRAFDRLAALTTPDARMELVPFGTSSTFRENAEAWTRAFPDARMEVRSIAGDGRHAFAEYVGHGTHRGPLQHPDGTIAPTGRKAELPFCESYDVRDGRITGGRMYFDTATLMAGLGLSPQAPRATGKPVETHAPH